jgi:hypothetical protein
LCTHKFVLPNETKDISRLNNLGRPTLVAILFVLRKNPNSQTQFLVIILQNHFKELVSKNSDFPAVSFSTARCRWREAAKNNATHNKKSQSNKSKNGDKILNLIDWAL